MSTKNFTEVFCQGCFYKIQFLKKLWLRIKNKKNVILTPHLAGLKANGQTRLGDDSARQIENFLNGRPLECEVTKEMLATIA